MSGFAVVEFLNESGALFVVPRLWINSSDNGKVCAWPPYKDSRRITSLVKSVISPDTSWEHLPINEMGKSKSYSKALRKLQECEIQSDVLFTSDTEHELSQSISSTPRHLQVSSRYIASTPTNHVHSQPTNHVHSQPTNHVHSQPTNNVHSQPTNNVHSQPTNNVHSQPTNNVHSQCTDCLHTQEMIKQLAYNLDAMHTEMKQQASLLQNVVNFDVPANTRKFDYLPVKDIKDLEKLNESVSNNVELAELVKIFGLLGGRDVREVVRKIMYKLLDNSLAVQLNWCGNGSKHAMKDFSNILQLIAVSVRQNPTFKATPQSAVDDAAKRWLRNASDREGGRMKRKTKENTAASLNVL